MAASGTQVDFESIKGFLVGTIVVFAAISAGLYALVAINVRKGKNWARILGTVFAALSLFNLFPLSLATLAALLGIAAIVLLYLPAASPYFQKRQPLPIPSGSPEHRSGSSCRGVAKRAREPGGPILVGVFRVLRPLCVIGQDLQFGCHVHLAEIDARREPAASPARS